MNVIRVDARWEYTDDFKEKVPPRIIVELSTPEAMRIANGGTIPPIELYDNVGGGISGSIHVGTLEVRRDVEFLREAVDE